MGNLVAGGTKKNAPRPPESDTMKMIVCTGTLQTELCDGSDLPCHILRLVLMVGDGPQLCADDSGNPPQQLSIKGCCQPNGLREYGARLGIRTPNTHSCSMEALCTHTSGPGQVKTLVKQMWNSKLQTASWLYVLLVTSATSWLVWQVLCCWQPFPC